MEDRSHFEVKKNEDEHDRASRLPDRASRLPDKSNITYGKGFIVALTVGVLVVGVLMAIGNTVIATLLGYIMPLQTAAAIAKSVPAILLISAIIAGNLLLKPKALTPVERDRLYSLKGETLEEIKELIGLNLRNGNREKANEWAAQALKFPQDSEHKRIK